MPQSFSHTVCPVIPRPGGGAGSTGTSGNGTNGGGGGGSTGVWSSSSTGDGGQGDQGSTALSSQPGAVGSVVRVHAVLVDCYFVTRVAAGAEADEFERNLSWDLLDFGFPPVQFVVFRVDAVGGGGDKDTMVLESQSRSRTQTPLDVSSSSGSSSSDGSAGADDDGASVLRVEQSFAMSAGDVPADSSDNAGADDAGADSAFAQRKRRQLQGWKTPLTHVQIAFLPRGVYFVD